MNKKIKTITSWLAATVFLMALVINVKVTLDDPFALVSETVLATSSGGSSGGGANCTCRSPQIIYGQCNQRIESIPTHCVIITINRTYYNANGEVCGTAVITGGIITASTGVATETYEDVTSTEEFDATRVNCPTDGSCNNCEEYKPCN